MGFLQTVWRHFLKLSITGGRGSDNEESLTASQMEFKLFTESLNYNPMMNHLVRKLTNYIIISLELDCRL